MIVEFFVYDTTGAIVRTGRCQQELVPEQAGPGETAREGLADDETQRWDKRTKRLVPKEPDPVDEGAALARLRALMVVSPRQLFIGMVQSGFATPEEGIAAATSGAMPEAVETAISGLPPADQFAARVTWASMGEVRRTDPLVGLLAASMGLTDEAVDDFFTTCASI